MLGCTGVNKGAKQKPSKQEAARLDLRWEEKVAVHGNRSTTCFHFFFSGFPACPLPSLEINQISLFISKLLEVLHPWKRQSILAVVVYS